MRQLILPAILAAFFLIPQQALCQDAANGGFSGPVSGAMADTAAKAKGLADDAPVALTGNIESQVAGKKDKFIFRDATGQIRVEIDKKVFAGRTVTPQDTVKISGKVDKDFGEDAEIDVKQLDIVK